MLFTIILAGCNRKMIVVAKPGEDLQAKSLLQGIWRDVETEEISFKVEGDTVYFPDSTSMPSYFEIVDDSLYLGSSTYPIVKQTSHVFWFRNQNGDVVKLTKNESTGEVPEYDDFDFTPAPQKVQETATEAKVDSIVMYSGQRYHWYVTINPTQRRVKKTTYTDDGVGVEKVYSDNIIHLGVFRGGEKVFSRNFVKANYEGYVPDKFLAKAILSSIKYHHIDAQGVHFTATLSVPDDASCYLVDTIIKHDGEVGMKTLE